MNLAKKFSVFLLLFFFSLATLFAATEKPFDHSPLDQFLKTYVNEDGQVNYSAAKKDGATLKPYLEQFRTKKPDEVLSMPREELLAFWLNIYNALMIQVILDHYPLKSVQQIPGIWDIQSFRMGRKSQVRESLNSIMKGRLMNAFRDEKIYAALSCGAKSCPKLAREAFTGTTVEGKLFLATRQFVNDPVRNQITPGEKKIYLSSIFKWYARDFLFDFGTAENERGLPPYDFAVLSFIANYLDDFEKVRFLEEGNYKIKYLPFDWDLNEWKPSPESTHA